MKYIILIAILILLVGCSSFEDCYNKCIEVNKGKEPQFYVKECIMWNTLCMSTPSKELREYCYEDCKLTSSIEKTKEE